jgi:hypothetical protein
MGTLGRTLGISPSAVYWEDDGFGGCPCYLR